MGKEGGEKKMRNKKESDHCIWIVPAFLHASPGQHAAASARTRIKGPAGSRSGHKRSHHRSSSTQCDSTSSKRRQQQQRYTAMWKVSRSLGVARPRPRILQEHGGLARQARTSELNPQDYPDAFVGGTGLPFAGDGASPRRRGIRSDSFR